MKTFEEKISDIVCTQIKDTSDWGVVGYSNAVDLILKSLIPTLTWKDNTNVSFSTGGGQMCVIRKTDDYYTTTFPSGFTGTLEECKHHCSIHVRDEYLKLCQ